MLVSTPLKQNQVVLCNLIWGEDIFSSQQTSQKPCTKPLIFGRAAAKALAGIEKVLWRHVLSKLGDNGKSKTKKREEEAD